jgi:Flp pilus assembly pilin Flp
MRSILRHMLPDEEAATLVEYALIALLIATATVAAAGRIGQAVLNVLGTVANTPG